MINFVHITHVIGYILGIIMTLVQLDVYNFWLLRYLLLILPTCMLKNFERLHKQHNVPSMYL